MMKKVLLGLLAIVVIIIPMFAACGTKSATSTAVTSAPAAPAPVSTTTTPVNTTTAPVSTTTVPPQTTQNNWWDSLGEPKYGGNINVSVTELASINLNLRDSNPTQPYWCDTMFAPSWTASPDVFSSNLAFVPLDSFQGLLADTWEMTDPLTMTVHLKKGVHWQNKPPVNGREFTADDVLFNYDMQMGTGNGYTEPSPFRIGILNDIAKVTAPDKYTVVFTLKKHTIWAQFTVIDPSSILSMAMMAPETAKEGQTNPASLTDWHNAVGTGAFMLTDVVPNASLTLTRNPDYSGVDERHPQNKLPYMDSFRIVAINDMTSALSAMRTGKIDMVPSMPGFSPQQLDSLTKSNPEILQIPRPFWGETIDMRCDTKPFTDINVRKALQMAIDTKAIAKSIYGGTVDGVPSGLLSPLYKGYTLPFDQWPKDLQDEYTFNQPKARELLATAGYPDGFDTNIVMLTPMVPTDLIQAIQSYFNDIKVNMEIRPMDPPSGFPFLQAGKQTQMSAAMGATGFCISPLEAMLRHSMKDPNNHTLNNDPKYEAMVEKISNATTVAEAQAACLEADMYNLSQHWSIQVCPIKKFLCLNPRVKGYLCDPGMNLDFFGARWWVDDSAKK
jgi:peptide/nickel transport system substrate-binding protein